MNRVMKTAIAATASVPMLATNILPASAIQPAWFSLRNRTGMTMTRFYVTPSNSRHWGKDLLRYKVLRSGRSAKVTIDDGRRTCRYDFMSVMSNGKTVKRYRVNICKLQTYTLY